MTMPMVKVGIVRVFVAHRRVVMRVGVRLAGRITGLVGMQVMVIVNMSMLMIHRLVAMVMLVSLRQMQVDADRHQDRRAGQLRGDGLME